ncbi:FAD binding domain containing protein [Neofusicoccum parvum]|uniref:FAD binding domain containing protein n=1 Tax=Neofusicoccum parvum TaxID=310453 RepID=A0ACB5SP09_9PEZI|nr:FAD binding domain containing protein [Neofusicoccum parvum]GME66429.1 FAD binding domain containing protein [Neofusicoccum parvum]
MPGAGGLTVGGGISFFNARVGFVCDSVANFEIVLASGEIVNANKEENADLWQALKGGSNNFGIVTRIDMMTFENGGDLWGGFIYYDNSTAEQHVKAFTHFVDKIESDPNASNILFTATSPIFRTCTFQNDERVLMKALELSADWTERFKHESIEGDWVSATQFHPIPKIFSERSVERGGNVLGLERFSSNLVVFLAVFTWEDATKDSLFHSAAEQLIGDVVEFSRSLGKDNEWIYLNYADKDQNPLESYGPENVAKIRAAAAKYDPDGIFQTLVPGGFKISGVSQ